MRKAFAGFAAQSGHMRYILVATLGFVLIAATPRPTPTPTPVALQYVELSKMIMPGGEQPEPGTFTADLQAATGGATAAAAGQNAATPTPAPRHHGLGGLVGSVLSGTMPGGSPGSAGAPPNLAGMMGGGGSAVRYTFYYTKNWVREDNLAQQTATISKCPQHQFISLNLANKTYRITDTTPTGCNTSSPAMRGGRGYSAAPGTVDLTMKSTSKNLGPKTVEGIATNGNDASIEMSMTNATGSCTNMNMQMRRIAYISGIHKPRAYCPLVNRGYTGMPGGGAMGGCKPTVHSSGGGNAMMASDNLEMWVLTIMNQVNSLMERGQVAWLYKPQTDPLFEIPAGFTEEK